MSPPYSRSQERAGSKLRLVVNSCSRKLQVPSAGNCPERCLDLSLDEQRGVLRPCASGLGSQLLWWCLELVPVDIEPWFHPPKQEEEEAALRQNVLLGAAHAARQPGEVLCEARSGCGSWWG